MWWWLMMVKGSPLYDVFNPKVSEEDGDGCGDVVVLLLAAGFVLWLCCR